MITKKRFKQLWVAAFDGPKDPNQRYTSADEGSSQKLRDAIEKAEDNDECLALTDWTDADF
jgi:hypothetical protein